MGISGISPYSSYNSYISYAGYANRNTLSMNPIQGIGALGPGRVEKAESKAIVNPGESTKVMPGKKSSPAECETCKERKYKDGSDEGNVSFKAASHVSPQAAGAAVRAHENQHVSNAYKKAANGNGEVLKASVSIKTAVCPECGRSYVSGGETNTMIKYSNEKNPYVQNAKSADRGVLAGMNFDAKG